MKILLTLLKEKNPDEKLDIILLKNKNKSNEKFESKEDFY